MAGLLRVGSSGSRLARVHEPGTPWDLARTAARAANVELRPLTALAELDDAVGVMVATWGAFQLPPRELLIALAHSGNVPFGAYDGDRLIGFVLGWAGVDGDGLHVHSHMLAALPDRRHRGVGYALKLGQRAQALEQDIHVARWTFDPLVARNAWFNLGKLGAVADGFGRAFYGEMTDEINAGDRSDRLVVRWDLDPDPRHAAGQRASRPCSRRKATPTALFRSRAGHPATQVGSSRCHATTRGSAAGTRRSRLVGARPPPRRSRPASAPDRSPARSTRPGPRTR